LNFKHGYLTMKKKTLIMSICLIVIVIVLCFGIYRFLFSRSYRNTVAAPTSAPVYIYRLDKEYSFIQAKTRDDAFSGLGFVHARDRLKQIEFLRIMANGTCVQNGISHYGVIDKLVLAVGLHLKAATLTRELSPTYKNYLQHYVDGINAYKEKRAEGNTSQQWEVEDVVRISLFLEFANAFLTNTELFFPVYDADYPLLNHEIYNKKIVRSYSPDDDTIIRQIKKLRDALASLFGLYGSYCRGFAVALPARVMDTDNATLCLSYENSISIYPLIYPVIIQIEKNTVQGYTFAGLPYIIAGKTDAVRFASFSVMADTQIFCKHPTQTNNTIVYYQSAAGYKELSKEQSSNYGSRFTDTGAVISDAFDESVKDTVIALAYVSPEKGYFEAMLDAPFATSLNEYVRIANGYKGQPRVFIVQDGVTSFQIIAGNTIADNDSPVLATPQKALIAKTEANLFEVKQVDMLVAGSEMIENPSFAVQKMMIFNNLMRFKTIQDAMTQVAIYRDNDVAALLTDIKYPAAQQYLTIMNNLLEKMPITSAKLANIYFQEWNFAMNKDYVAPTLYNAIITSLVKETFTDELPYNVGDMVQHYMIFEPEFLRIFQEDKSPYFDDTATVGKLESRDLIFDRAFLHSLNYFNYTIGPYIDKWRWGKVIRGIVDDKTPGSNVVSRVKKKKTISLSGFDNTVFRNLIKRQDYSIDSLTVCASFMDENTHRMTALISPIMNLVPSYYTDINAATFFTINVNNKHDCFTINPVK